MTPLLRCAIGLAIGLAAPLGAQTPERFDPVGALATGDELAVERGRRVLLAAASVEPRHVATLAALLGHEDGYRRRAAASVLAGRGALDAAVLERVLGDPDPEVRAIAVPHAGPARLAELVRRDPDPGVRVRALQALLDAGAVDAATWRQGLTDGSSEVRSATARLFVCEAWPWPEGVVERLDLQAALPVLEMLAERPRRAAAPWLSSIAEREGTDAATRRLAVLGLPPATWSRAMIKDLLDGLSDPESARYARIGLDMLSPSQADALVADVHRRILAGENLDELLPALEKVSEAGERHLVGVARAFDDAQRSAIVDWLGRRSPDVLQQIVADALAGDFTLTPELLRRAGPFLDDGAVRARVVAMLADAESPTRVRDAAFRALVEARVWTPELLTYAFEPPPEGDPVSRSRQVLSLPLEELPPEAWRRFLDATDSRVRREALQALAREGGAAAAVEDLLVATALAPGPDGDFAARILIGRGARERAERVWKGLPEERRLGNVTSWRHRPDDAAWILPLLAGLPEEVEVAYTRLWLGERSVLGELLDDPARWPARWLVRMQEPATAALEATDVARLAALVHGSEAVADAAARRELVRWLAARPDLGGAEVLEAVWRDDADDEVRAAALRGLLAREAPAAALRERVEAALSRGLREAERDLAFEVLGALVPPLEAAEVRLLARLLLIAPLAHEAHELRIALGEEPVSDIALLNQAWALVGKEPSPHTAEAFRAVAEEFAAHPASVLCSRERLGRALMTLAAEARTRATAAPPLARLVVEVPDREPRFLGPAYVVLAEEQERGRRFLEAAETWERAMRAMLRHPPEPLVARAIVGDTYRGAESVPAAMLAARPWLARARAALASGDHDAALAAAEAAELRAFGDAESEAEVRALLAEIRR